MSSMKSPLIPDSPSKKGLHHAGTSLGVSIEHKPLREQSNSFHRSWTVATSASNDEKFKDVHIDDVLKHAHAGTFTIDELHGKNKTMGRMLRHASVFLDGLAPPEQQVEQEKPDAEKPDEGKETGCTNGEAVLNLLNNCLGSGMLSMGFSIAQTGLIGGALIMMFSALLNRHTLMLNIKSSAYAGCKPASTEVGSIAYGTVGRLLLVLMVAALGFFCMVSYVDASADAVVGLLTTVVGDAVNPWKKTIAIVCWLVLLVPPTLIRSMSLVAILSFVAFIGCLVIVVGVTVVCVSILVEQGLPPIDKVRMFPESLSSILNAFPILMLVFSVQAGGDVVLVTMKDTSEKNMYKILNLSYCMTYVLLYFVGSLCYVTWLDEVQGDVLENFSSTSLAGVIARLASLDLVVLSYMIMMIPCKVSLIDLIFGKNEALQESTPAQFYGTTMVLNVLALLTALVVSDLSLVLRVDGAVCTNFVAFMLPAAFWIKLQSKPADPSLGAVAMFSPRNWMDAIIFVLGLISLVSSSYQLVQRASA